MADKMTIEMLGAAIAYLARERSNDIPVMLWAVLQSDEMRELVHKQEAPEAYQYRKLAEIDQAIYHVFSSSETGRRLLQKEGEPLELETIKARASEILARLEVCGSALKDLSKEVCSLVTEEQSNLIRHDMVPPSDEYDLAQTLDLASDAFLTPLIALLRSGLKPRSAHLRSMWEVRQLIEHLPPVSELENLFTGTPDEELVGRMIALLQESTMINLMEATLIRRRDACTAEAARLLEAIDAAREEEAEADDEVPS